MFSIPNDHVGRILLLAGLLSLWSPLFSRAADRTIVDAAGRRVAIPHTVERVICSGSGCLRLLTYLQAQDKAVAVDAGERRVDIFDARPYALASPRFQSLPVFGEPRGFDQPELILGLKHPPQVIFKTFASGGYDPQRLQDKTGITVVVLAYGDLGSSRRDFYQALRTMGAVLGKTRRAEEVIAFCETAIRDLARRSAAAPGERRPTCYVGGIASRGPHGFPSTEPGYPPLAFTHAVNVAAADTHRDTRHCSVAKEQIMAWDPDIILLDLSTLQMGPGAGGLFELRSDPAYRMLSAVRRGAIYGVLPYNSYAQNFESTLADAYFVGTLVHPRRFADIDPRRRADEIYSFFVGRPLFATLNKTYQGLAFQRINP